MDYGSRIPSIKIYDRELKVEENLQLTTVEKNDKISPIKQFLTDGTLPEEKELVRRLRFQSLGYVLLGENCLKNLGVNLYYVVLGTNESQMTFSELLDGEGSAQCGYISLIKRVLLAGFYWSTIQGNAKEMVKCCDTCQRYSHIIHVPGLQH